MPQNKRESLIFTIIMCFTMVLWMSMYNVTLHMGGFSMTVLKEGWLDSPSPTFTPCALTGLSYHIWLKVSHSVFLLNRTVLRLRKPLLFPAVW